MSAGVPFELFKTESYVVNMFFNQPPLSCQQKHQKARCTPGGMTLSLLAMSSMKRVTPGHVGLIEDGGCVVIPLMFPKVW